MPIANSEVRLPHPNKHLHYTLGRGNLFQLKGVGGAK